MFKFKKAQKPVDVNKNFIASLADGTEIEVVTDGDQIAVGVGILVDGEPAPEGQHTLGGSESGNTIVVDSEGTVTEYSPSSDEDTEESDGDSGDVEQSDDTEDTLKTLVAKYNELVAVSNKLVKDNKWLKLQVNTLSKNDKEFEKKLKVHNISVETKPVEGFSKAPKENLLSKEDREQQELEAYLAKQKKDNPKTF